MQVDSQPWTRRRFELVDDLSYRFWELWVAGSFRERRCGKIGRTGRRLRKEFADPAVAMSMADGMVTEKKLDGYQEVDPRVEDKIPFRSLARLEKSQVNPAIRKAVRIYAGTTRAFCSPRFARQDINDPAERRQDLVLGGLPYLSSSHPWPRSERGQWMQFLAQVDLDKASSMLGEEFGSGLLQVWAHDYEECDRFLVRVIDREALQEPLVGGFPENFEVINREGVISVEGIGNRGRALVQWRNDGRMHYPSPWDRVCRRGERLEVIDPVAVAGALEELSERDDWRDGLFLPTFKGLRGKPMPNVYLGGYSFSEGNGWDLHDAARPSLLNIWCDTGILWHLCVSRCPQGEFHVGVSCTR